MDMMKTGLLASASFALLVSADPAPAQELPEVKVISFHNGNNWPIWAAEARGDFAKNGIRIALTYTPGSEALITGLVEGKFDIAGLRTVLTLRNEYGEPRKTLADPMKYYDPSYYKKALGN
jgi:ABC-type nitrate/sulfonate/bicarbonate transport system substrate-binding protein